MNKSAVHPWAAYAVAVVVAATAHISQAQAQTFSSDSGSSNSNSALVSELSLGTPLLGLSLVDGSNSNSGAPCPLCQGGGSGISGGSGGNGGSGSVPLPGSIPLVGAGLAAYIWFRRRK